MSLDLLQVVLVQTRFPENIGMAARACVNMGSRSIRLVAPERWDREKARPLATPKGQGVLDDVQVLSLIHILMSCWCRGRESNPHGGCHYHLKIAVFCITPLVPRWWNW